MTMILLTQGVLRITLQVPARCSRPPTQILKEAWLAPRRHHTSTPMLEQEAGPIQYSKRLLLHQHAHRLEQVHFRRRQMGNGSLHLH